MPTPLYTYTPPGVQVIPSGPVAVATAPTINKIIQVVDTFPKGPAYPTLVSGADARSVFGDPADASSSGFNGPWLIDLMRRQAQPNGRNQDPYFLVCRVGTSPAQAIVVDGASGTAFTMNAIGPYAGTAGRNLAYTITVTSGAVISINIFDVTTGTPVLLRQYLAGRDDLSSNTAIAGTINSDNPLTNPASIVQVVGPYSASLPTAVGTATAFTDGSPGDGYGVAPTNASIPGLLAQSLWSYADYIVSGFDGAAIAPAIQTHQANAIAAGQWRKAVLGPAVGTIYSSLAGSYWSGLGSDRLWPIQHDAAFVLHPMTGKPRLAPGGFIAAAFAALKAVGPTEETTTRMPLAGITGIGIAPGKNGPLTPAELNALAVSTTGQGGIVLDTLPNGASPFIRHALTSAPRTYQGGINAFSEVNARDVDDLFSKTVSGAALAFIGRPFNTRAAAEAGILQGVNTATAQMGTAIGGYAHSVTTDPQTNAPTVSSTYIMPTGVNSIIMKTGFSFA